MENIKKLLEEWNVNDIDDKISKLEIYMTEILEWNKKINMTAITDRDEFIKKHYLDSISIANIKQYDKATKIVDLGTGGGFPGIPLAIISPEKEFILVDSLRKRLLVISEIAENIRLNNIKTLHIRAEDMGRSKEHREKYDMCVSRAVANLSTLSEYCIPLIKKSGYFIAYKGEKVEKEILDAKKAIKILGGEIKESIQNYELSKMNINHNLVIVKKIKNTEKKFPRKSGIPAKEPIV